MSETKPESIGVSRGWALWLVLVSVTFITLTFYNKAAARAYHDQVCVLRLAAAETEIDTLRLYLDDDWCQP